MKTRRIASIADQLFIAACNRYAKAAKNIVHWDEDSDDYDPWVAADQAEDVMKKSGIRVDRTKELALIALNDSDDVVGASFHSLEPDHDSEDDSFVFGFDVAVLPEYRGSIGLKLIDASLDEFRSIQSDHPNSMIRLWVVNPKLVNVLERKYGFDIDSKHSDGSAHMSKN